MWNIIITLWLLVTLTNIILGITVELITYKQTINIFPTGYAQNAIKKYVTWATLIGIFINLLISWIPFIHITALYNYTSNFKYTINQLVHADLEAFQSMGIINIEEIQEEEEWKE